MDTAQTWTMIGGFLGLFTAGVVVLGHALRSLRGELVARIDAVGGLLDAHQRQTAAGFAALTARSDRSDARVHTLDGAIEALGQRTIDRFDTVERRFTDRFDALDQRLTARFDQSDAHIDTVDTKLNTLDQRLTDRFDALDQRLTARFDQSDARIDTVDTKLNTLDQRLTARFEQSDARIDALTAGQYELAGRISTLEGSVTEVRAILQPIADELLRAGITGRKPGA